MYWFGSNRIETTTNHNHDESERTIWFHCDLTTGQDGTGRDTVRCRLSLMQRRTLIALDILFIPWWCHHLLSYYWLVAVCGVFLSDWCGLKSGSWRWAWCDSMVVADHWWSICVWSVWSTQFTIHWCVFDTDISSEVEITWCHSRHSWRDWLSLRGR
jgi:hypothetical protein